MASLPASYASRMLRQPLITESRAREACKSQAERVAIITRRIWVTKPIRRVNTCLVRRPEAGFNQRTWYRLLTRQDTSSLHRNSQRVSIAGPVKINTGRTDVFRSFTRETRPRNDVKPRAQIFEFDALSENPVASRISPPLEELRRTTRERHKLPARYTTHESLHARVLTTVRS
jgi:hypothetical protein